LVYIVQSEVKRRVMNDERFNGLWRGWRTRGSLVGLLAIIGCGTHGARVPQPDGAAGGSVAGTVDGDSVTVPASGPIDYDSACNLMAHLLCKQDVACCGGRGMVVDEDKCVAWRRQSFGRVAPFPGTCEAGQAAGTGYDPEQARTCIAEIARTTQACLAPLRADDPAKARVDRACDTVFAHTPNRLPGPGEFCRDECTAPAGMVSICHKIADVESNSFCGSAEPARTKGEPCGDGCLQSLVCLKSQLCGTPQADGTACDRDLQCSSGTCGYPTEVCLAPPPVTDQHCGHLRDVSSYQLYFDRPAPDDRALGINDRMILWPSSTASLGTRYAPKDGSGPVASFTASGSNFWPTLVDNEYLYGESDYQVQRTALTDGRKEILFSLPKGGSLGWYPMAVSGGSMMVASWGCEALVRVNLAAPQFAPPSTILPSPPNCRANTPCSLALAIEDQTVYCSGGKRLSAFFEDGTAQVLSDEATLDDVGGIQQLEALDGRLYYSTPGKLFMFDVATRTATLLQPPLPPTSRWLSSGPPPSLKLARGRLYWSTKNAIQSYDIRQETFVSIDMGDVLGESDTQLAVDADFIYWMTGVGIFRRALD
jgi:hypothetical protein